MMSTRWLSETFCGVFLLLTITLGKLHASLSLNSYPDCASYSARCQISSSK